MRFRQRASFSLVTSLLLAAPVLAQLPTPPPLVAEPASVVEGPPPISLSYVDGRADLVRQDGIQAAQVPDLLQEDDRLVTGEGRAELAFGDGSLAHVDRQSDLRIDLGVRLRLVSGRVRLQTPADIEPLYVSTPAGPVRLAAGGIYDLTANDLRGDTVIAVREGHAALVTGDNETPIGEDDVLSVDPRDPRPRWARGAPRDAFVDWSDRRLAVATSARYSNVPAPIRPWAADLEAHGQWSSIDPYGAVWFPAAGPSWRPYLHGSWRHTRYGWTWIDAERWAWPVHHYGRWGHHAARGWYWIPHRAWGPAWVSWAVAADHVAWSPLGWDRRPLVDFSVGARLGPVGLFAASWSILPRHAFGRRGPVFRDLADARYLPGPVLGGFVSQMIGPRGPAGPGDRFAVRLGRRAGPSTPPPPRGYRQPPVAYQPRGTEPTRSERPSAAEPRRRPIDAPPREVLPIEALPTEPSEAAGARPPERVWSPAPVASAPGEGAGSRRPPREVAPVGAPVRAPRGEAPAAPPPSSGAAGRGGDGGWSATRRPPATDGAGAGAGGQARPRRGESGRGSPGGAGRAGGSDAGQGRARPRG